VANREAFGFVQGNVCDPAQMYIQQSEIYRLFDKPHGRVEELLLIGLEGKDHAGADRAFHRIGNGQIDENHAFECNHKLLTSTKTGIQSTELDLGIDGLGLFLLPQALPVILFAKGF
jgi:hypothetical protein